MDHGAVEEAAHNNARWCDAVCRAHGRPGEFHRELWLNRRDTPRFYPNAVTLSRDEKPQLERIGELIDAELAGEWGVKDSFCSLSLAPLGFRVLFEAEWIRRSAGPLRGSRRAAHAGWTRVRGADELAAWEAAWSGRTFADGDAVFRRGLLEDRDIAIIACHRGGAVVAGAIANRTGEVVGLSNFFSPADEAEERAEECIAAIVDLFPGLAIVGYDSGTQLARFRRLGFETLGPLRVWVQGQTTGCLLPCI